MKNVAVVGVGVMGRVAAEAILAKGHSVVASDPSPQALEYIQKCGATTVGSLGEAVTAADVIIMFLPGPAQVRQVVAGANGVLANAPKGAVIVDHSTIDPDTSRDMAKLAEEAGFSYIDAPVLGRPSAVGNWCLPIGQTEGALEKCSDVLECYAGNVIPAGAPGNGNTIKLLNQMMFGAINAMTAEMMAVASTLGVEPSKLYEIMITSQAGTVSNLFKELGSRISEDNYDDPTFSVDLLIKDVNLGVEMARKNNAPVLMGRIVEQLNETARAQGYGAQDTSVMWKALKNTWNNDK